MARATRKLPERLYGSVIGWEGWSFRVVSSAIGVRYLDLGANGFPEIAERLSARIVTDDRTNETPLRQLHEYLAGERRGFTVALDLHGTDFQRAVWDALRQIPYGATVSYSDIAHRIGRPRALRAVGQALARNPVPIIVPCHRVVGSAGQLVGFGGGLPLKERLIALEAGSLDL